MDNDYPLLEYKSNPFLDSLPSHSPDMDTEWCKNHCMSSVVQYIKKEMDSRGLNPRTLASAAGMNYSTLHRILHSQGEPRRTTLEPLARYFRVSIDDLFAEANTTPLTPRQRADLLYDELMTLPADQRAALLARLAESLSK